jgi:hypothetical protein
MAPRAGDPRHDGTSLLRASRFLHTAGVPSRAIPFHARDVLAMGDALAAQGRQDAACDAWHRASLIFSAFLLPPNAKVQSRLARSANETVRL